ncbi:The BTB (BR-C, ttk and bab)/POZ (Pox virus and Zinc finger) domain [Ceratobasidium sp. AG-Ba]|nr:The BTB (BR-C, ttk and bab)/POZ (Pox virus and Zinc finger) domain [Ceratobasidium sp. AG-Ba]
MSQQPINRVDVAPERITSHSQYFDVIVLKIENTLFTVHKYQLLKSQFFREILEAPQGNIEGSPSARPIAIDGVLASDFESLLSVLYTPRISSQEPPLDLHYIPAFRLANQWNFEDLKRDLLPLVERQLNDVDKIGFARQYNLQEWMIESHIKLCQRREALTHEEAGKLGLDKQWVQDGYVFREEADPPNDERETHPN